MSLLVLQYLIAVLLFTLLYKLIF